MTPVRPGDVLAGKYRVEHVLGSGGMGYVVAARHLQLDQLVAMKFLRTTPGQGSIDQTEASGRFLREAKAVVKLRNEHVARVFDVGTLDTGEPYIVMEYLDGADLAAIAKQRGQLPVPEAVEYILQACEALGEAHSLGIVHRDVKLANLFVSRGPTGLPLVKVLDFGISKMNPFGDADHDMTRTSSMLGSPRFMSPEQMNDPRTVDARSDIWSLGVVLYRLVAGRAPFEADMLGRLLTMVMHEAPPPLAMIAPHAPPGFAQIVTTCLQKDRQFRFANIAELAYALAPFAFDVAGAHAIAERIAAMLSVPQPTGSIPLPPEAMPNSVHSNRMDSVTAAPWTGAGPVDDVAQTSSRSSLVWGSIALAMLLALTGIFAKLRSDRDRAAVVNASQNSGGLEGAFGAPVEAPLGSPTGNLPEPMPPHTSTETATPTPKSAANGNATANGGASAPGVKSAPTIRGSATVNAQPAYKPARNPAQSGTPSTPATANGAGNAVRPQEGIPSTRD